ncbi:MAG TPA: thioredoxin-disulfide reductase [Myxococcales bacterium]|nr:thioredoxin-disulfide reductase [Myxococcales bacterium]
MEKVIIIGSGPAGLTAAIYSARAQLEPLVLEGGFLPSGEIMTPGGQLMITTDVENFPGFPEGITGPDLVEKTREQAKRFGSRHRDAVAEQVDFSGFPLKVMVEGQWLEAATVVISTGANARWLGLPSEQKYMNRGVSACATCDGAFYKDQKLLIVGGGDSAMEEALFLTRYATEVVIIHRREEFRASKIMADRAIAHPKISVQWNREVEEILGDGQKVTGARLSSTTGQADIEVDCGGVFVAIGHTPNTSIFDGHIELRADRYIQVYENCKTSAKGVFVAGDCADSHYRQAITAAGMGCMAALDAEKLLEEYESEGLLG